MHLRKWELSVHTNWLDLDLVWCLTERIQGTQKIILKLYFSSRKVNSNFRYCSTALCLQYSWTAFLWATWTWSEHLVGKILRHSFSLKSTPLSFTNAQWIYSSNKNSQSPKTSESRTLKKDLKPNRSFPSPRVQSPEAKGLRLALFGVIGMITLCRSGSQSRKFEPD